MISRCLTTFVLVGLLAGFVGANGSEPSSEQNSGALPLIHVGPDAQVSRASPDRMLFETDLAAHPSDPTRMLACSMIYTPEDNSNHNVAYFTEDGEEGYQYAHRR